MKKKSTTEEAPSGKQANLHDSFFKKIFKQPKYLKELLRAIFPPEAIASTHLDDIVIQDGELLTHAGRQLRADLIASLPLRVDAGDVNVTLSFIFEHKSYKDPDVLIQIMEYYIELYREQIQQWRKDRAGKRQGTRKRNITAPMVLLCCKDKDFCPASDYLQWVFRDEDIPESAKIFAPWLPKLFGSIVNFRQLPASEASTVTDSLAIIAYGMGELWDANDDTLAYLFDKAQYVPRSEAEYLLTMLRDYYGDADNNIERQDFSRVERERWPELKEEERLMPTIDFGIERATRLGIKQGIKQGLDQGIKRGLDQGIKRGLDQGIKRGRQDERRQFVIRLLKSGELNDESICRIAQVSEEQLLEIKDKISKN